MGNSSSKAASRAASAAKRSYPSTTTAGSSGAPSTSQPQPHRPAHPAAEVRPSPTAHPSTDHKSNMIELDARDPHFASSLSRAGRAQRVPQPSQQPTSAATPQSSFPTSSRPPHLQQAPTGQNIFPSQNATTSTNPALQIVAARDRITRQFAAEQDGIGRKGFEGRTLLAARELREAFNMRQAGIADEEVERSMRLKRGTLARLPVEVVGNVSLS